jgi:hypothetical protein
VSNTTPLVDEVVKISATVKDLDNDPLAYAWTSSCGKVVGNGVSATWSSSTPNTCNVTLQVSDGRGGTIFGTVTIVAHGNFTPALTATSGAVNGVINLVWTEVTHAVDYNIHYALTTGVSAADPFVTDPTPARGFDCSANPGVKYYFIVYPVNAAGVVGNVSNEAAAICPPLLYPPNFTVTVPRYTGANYFTLSWSPSPNALYYDVLYEHYESGLLKTQGTYAFGTSPVVTGSPTTGLSLKFSCMPNGCYEFGIRARNGALVSDTFFGPANGWDCLSPPAFKGDIAGSNNLVIPKPSGFGEFCPWPAYVPSGPPYESAQTPNLNDTFGKAFNTGVTIGRGTSYYFGEGIQYTGDVDYFSFNAGSAVKIVVYIDWWTAANLVDFAIVGSDGTVVATSQSSGFRIEGPITWYPTVADANKAFYLKIWDASGVFDWYYVYIISQ